MNPLLWSCQSERQWMGRWTGSQNKRYKWPTDSSSSSSMFPAIALGFIFFWVTFFHMWVSQFLVRFLHMWRFSNPTIEVVTFLLRECFIRGGSFVAGIHPTRTWMPGSFESVRWNACVHRLHLGLYSHPKEFLEIRLRTYENSKGKIFLYGQLRGGWTRDSVSRRTASPTHYRLSYSSPPTDWHGWSDWEAPGTFCMCPGHLCVRVGDSSWPSEEIAKNLQLHLSMSLSSLLIFFLVFCTSRMADSFGCRVSR